MKKMFLENLPRYKKGTHKDKINWKESIGQYVHFVYDNMEGDIKIVDYSNNNIFIEYNGEIKDRPIKSNHFLMCKIGCYINAISYEFKYEVNDIIVDDKRNITIIERINDGGRRYKYRCNKCGNVGFISEYKNNGCNVCSTSPRKVVSHINSIKSKHPWMINLGMSEEDANKYSYGSSKKVKVICPNCGSSKEIAINKIYTYKSIGCKCGDGFSYPEKITYSILKQLHIEFKIQLSKTTLKWCNGYRYDFYFYYNDNSYIIETHGGQHYKESNRGRTLEQEQLNDKLKYELAIQNGIKPNNYIVVDCRKSELEFIKNSVLNSRLSQVFDLSKVDWNKCEEFSLSNLTKEVCNCWNNKEEWETTTKLEKIFNISKGTAINYLKKGTNLGWCNYNGKYEWSKNSIKNGKKNGKKVGVFSDDGVLIKEYTSCRELQDKSVEFFGIKLLKNKISEACRIGNKYKKLIFKYLE